MRAALIGGIALLVAGFVAPADAGQELADAGEASVDNGTLPVSLDRIKRRMAALPAEDDGLFLRLTTRINVYAPRAGGDGSRRLQRRELDVGSRWPDRRRDRLRLAHPQRDGATP